MPAATPPVPRVSVIIAAYGRPEVLQWAIQSVRAQTHTDWELIVVADACPATAQLMDSGIYADEPRLRFYNLAYNHGDQSGPNNLGMARARGRFIAFLNQDDLWFPDHLAICLDRIDATGADLVFSITGSMVPRSREQLVLGDWLGGLLGLTPNGFYDPVRTFAPASSWVLRRETARKVGYWKSATECHFVSSQDLLYRAWRRRLRLRQCPMLTVLDFSSGGRTDSYRTDLSHEQRWWFESMGLTPSARAQLWNRLAYAVPEPPGHRLRKFRHELGEMALSLLAHMGIDPKAFTHFFTHGYRQGDYINRLRRTRGLTPMPILHQEEESGRIQSVASACQYSLGTTIDFSCRGNAQSFQRDGWAFPEDWGTWTEGEQATLWLDIAEKPEPESRLVMMIEAQALIAGPCDRQRMVFSLNGSEHINLVFTQPGFFMIEVEIPVPLIYKEKLTTLTLHLPDSIMPAQISQSADRRRLGIGVKFLVIASIPPESHCR